MNQFRLLHGDQFETSLGRLSQSGEPESKRIHNGRAQEAYDDRAYPRKWIGTAQQLAAARAASAIATASCHVDEPPKGILRTLNPLGAVNRM